MSKLRAKIKRAPDKAIKKLEKLATALRKPGSVLVGLPKDSNDYPDGTSVIMVGAVHEFGSPARGVPQRSYLRTTIIEQKRAYRDLFIKLSKLIVKNKMTTEKALNILGLTVQTDVREKISDISEPALKAREGNPLVDTGHLRQSITFEVIK